MTRILLRYVNAPALLLLVILGVALQTSLFASYPLMYLQPDVVLIVVVWCALRRGFFEGGLLTLIVAEIAESHSASTRGLFLITYMAIFLLVRLASRLFVIPSLASLVMVTILASIAWKLGTFGVLRLLGAEANQWRHTLVLLLPGAVVEGAAAIWIFRWLERFDLATYKNPRAQKALDDEYQILDDEFSQRNPQ